MSRNSDELYKIVLNKNLTLAKKDEKKASLEFASLKTLILQKISVIEKLCPLKLLADKLYREMNKTIKIYQQKLFKPWILQRNKNPSSIVNLIKRKLSITKLESLQYSLQHHILPKKFYENNVKANLEILTYILRNKYKTQINQEFKDEIKYFQKFINRSKQVCATRNNQAIHRSKLNLSKDSYITVCKFNKGRRVAVLNFVDYFFKLDSIIQPGTKV